MPPRLVTGLGRRREGRVGERADRDDDQLRLRRLRVEDLRPALGAEMEHVLLLVRLVRDPREGLEPADDLHLIGPERGLHAERATGATLAGGAMADGYDERVALHLQAKLPAVAGRDARDHPRDPRHWRLRSGSSGG